VSSIKYQVLNINQGAKISMINQTREPQPIILPLSRREILASQPTLADHSTPVLPASAYCRDCSNVVEPGARFCGFCGSRLRYNWYVRA
jgi:hypothetical protein